LTRMFLFSSMFLSLSFLGFIRRKLEKTVVGRNHQASNLKKESYFSTKTKKIMKTFEGLIPKLLSFEKLEKVRKYTKYTKSWCFYIHLKL
jgi:hypothetical protein